MFHRNPKNMNIVECTTPHCPYGPAMPHFKNVPEAWDYFEAQLLQSAQKGIKLSLKEKNLLASYASKSATVDYLLANAAFRTWSNLLLQRPRQRLGLKELERVVRHPKFAAKPEAREHILRSLSEEEMLKIYSEDELVAFIQEFPYFASFRFSHRPQLKEEIFTVLESATDQEWAKGELQLLSSRLVWGDSWEESVALVARHNRLCEKLNTYGASPYLTSDLESRWQMRRGDLNRALQAYNQAHGFA